MRIGIMGGTFNPVHFGHLNSAEEIGEKFNLRQIIFIPTYITPQKEQNGVADHADRLDMLKMATESNKRFAVSTIEIDKGGISYSVDTIHELNKHQNGETTLFFIAGVDVFNDIAAWKEPDRLFKLCNFIINKRPEYNMDAIVDILRNTFKAKFPHISFTCEGRDNTVNADRISTSLSEYLFYTIETTQLNISSTDIRKRISGGKTVKYLLPEKVEKYIMDNGLYRTRKNVNFA